MLKIKDIQKNPYQPRKEFSEEKIQEEAAPKGFLARLFGGK